MSSLSEFASTVHEVADAMTANELFQREGWTDGLPIVPPMEDVVARFLEAARLAPDAVIGVEPVRRRSISAEKVAIAAVMAGCLPEYLSVVVAVVKAMCRPEYALHGSTASTGGSAPFIVVNGRPMVAGKFTFCVAEDEEDSPWLPLAVERGVPLMDLPSCPRI